MQKNYQKAKIIEINENNVKVEIVSGEKRGEVLEISQVDENQIKNLGASKNNIVLISKINGPDGQTQSVIVDHYRLPYLGVLFAIFIFVVVVVGRKKGIMSFLAMVLSFFLIIKMVIPQILFGNNPVLIALFASAIMIPVSFYISHGFCRKTTLAVISTFLSLVITGFLSLLFVHVSKLTGYAAEEAVFISIQNQDINLSSLLLAGIIIGAMGVLDDVTISQVSIVEKLKKANKKYSKRKLFSESMDVGQDHIASLVNTLVLVYAGAALPLFVLFSSTQFGGFFDVLNMEIIATEIVRTLVSSIGIILSVPITTFIATKWID